MAKRKIFLTIITIVIISIILLVGIGTFFYLTIAKELFLENSREGLTIQAMLFDENGNEIRDGTQTTVGGQAGVFYISFNLLIENIGNVDLTDVESTETHPNDLTIALEGESLVISSLIEEQQGLLGTTANDCVDNLGCSSNEKCVGTPKKCRIDVSNFLGLINFGFTAKGNFIHALGTSDEVYSERIDLPILFKEDGVLARFEKQKIDSIDIFKNSWIAVDKDKNGILEAYGGGDII